MRLAVFADIHGNDVAYQAAVEDAQRRGAQAYIVAGDLVSDFPFASAVIARTRALTPYVVKGNREDYFISYASPERGKWTGRKQYAGMRWAFERMSGSDGDYVRGLPGEMEIALDGGVTVYLTHRLEDPAACFRERTAQLIVGGHTHRPEELRLHGRRSLNPGSVGLNMSGGFQAEYGLVEIENGRLHSELIRAPYREEALTAFLKEVDDEAALNWFQMLLASQARGVNYAAELFRLSEEIQSQRGERADGVPDDVWDEIICLFKRKSIIPA